MSDSDQPTDSSLPPSGSPNHEDRGEDINDMVAPRECLFCRGNSRKNANNRAIRRGDTAEAVPLQNGNGGGGDDHGGRLLVQKHSPHKRKNLSPLDKATLKEAKKVSKIIDQELKQQKREYRQTYRLLLLGMSFHSNTVLYAPHCCIYRLNVLTRVLVTHTCIHYVISHLT